MDLSLTEDQAAIVDLADQILGDRCTPEQLKGIERGAGEDIELHGLLADADLLGLSVPESANGGGLGLVEAALVAESIGRHGAQVPVIDVVAVARSVAAADDPWAGDLTTGTIVRTALREAPDGVETPRPATVASPHEEGWILTGEKIAVTGPGGAAYYVSATAPDGIGLFVVGPAAAAEEVSRSSTGTPVLTVRFDRTPARRVGHADGAVALARLIDELQVLRCAQQAGVARGALALAATYCSEREQFGSKIGTFQAVAHRLADAWVDANAIEMTCRQAAWRIDNALPHEQALASAAYWACDGAHRIVHAAQHVHGGIGVDTDYPVHRYFRLAKSLELALGSGSRNLVALGNAIADEPLTIG